MCKTKMVVYWTPYQEYPAFSTTCFLDDLFEEQPQVVTVNLKNNKDPRSLYLLREADLVVVFLKQNEFFLNHYFVQDQVRNENIIYVMIDFVYDYHGDWSRIMNRYRIPEGRLFVIPFCQQSQGIKSPLDAMRFLKHAQQSDFGGIEHTFYCAYKRLREKLTYSLL